MGRKANGIVDRINNPCQNEICGNTLFIKTFEKDEDGIADRTRPAWECTCCHALTARQIRVTAKRRERDERIERARKYLGII